MNETQRFLGDKTTWAQAAARLDDVQPLWGDRRVWVTGRGVIQLAFCMNKDFCGCT